PLCAQERPDDVRAPLKVDIDRLVRQYVKAEARRNAGIALAGAGVALAILGGVGIGFAATHPAQLPAGVEDGAALISSAVRVAPASPGVVLWVTGQDDMDVATWRRKQLLTVSW